MYIETRYYDNGKVTAQLHEGYHEAEFKQLADYDIYLESIRDETNRPYEWESLEEWAEELGLDLEDLETLLLGSALDITNYV